MVGFELKKKTAFTRIDGCCLPGLAQHTAQPAAGFVKKAALVHF